MARYTFTGGEPAGYPDYLDGEGGSLVAEPGKTYEIEPAGGRTVADGKGGRVPLELPMPPDDRWKPATKAAATKKNSED